MQLALEHQGALLATGMLGDLSIAAFLCDRYGRVKASTPAAERLVSQHPALRLTHGSLVALQPRDAKTLSDAIEAAAHAGIGVGSAALRTVVLGLHAPGFAPLVLDVFAVRSRQAFEFSRFVPKVLIVARGPRGTDLQKGAVLKAVYGLTPAECEIALKLASGRGLDAIAAERAVTMLTVRHQVKSIMSKVGVSRQMELSALIAQL
jgi:DNA-binding CsgD family transcriptional regulator